MTEPTDKALLDALDQADGDRIRTVAVAWTWLEQRLQDLGSRRKKLHVIRTEARRRPPFEAWTADERARVAADPLLGAAELLVRIHEIFNAPTTPRFVLPAPGFDSEPMFVIWKTPTLSNWSAETDVDEALEAGPPAANEHPSLAALAPRLVVCPRRFNQIELELVKPKLRLPGWRAAWNQLERGLVGPAHNDSERRPDEAAAADRKLLSVHLDALGSAGQSGWRPDPDPALAVGVFDEATIDRDDERRCGDDAERAVRAASGRPAVLVMPELVATSRIEERIVAALASEQTSPALTVVGRYHRCAPPEELASDRVADLASHVNEALVLAPDGSELWRHRKLMYAQAPPRRDGADDEPEPGEDIRLGRVLKIVPLPVGMTSVVICLDTFAPTSRQRIERSGADVLLVPSLSPHVKRHRASLQQLVQTLWGIAFVCNRALKPLRASANADDASGIQGHHDPHDTLDGGSFWTVQRKDPCVPEPCPDSPSCVVFRLGRGCAQAAPLKLDSSMLDR